MNILSKCTIEPGVPASLVRVRIEIVRLVNEEFSVDEVIRWCRIARLLDLHIPTLRMHAILVTPTPSLFPETHSPITVTGMSFWSIVVGQSASSSLVCVHYSLEPPSPIATSPLTQSELFAC